MLRSVQISQEADRRRRLDAISAERAAAIKEAYRPLHPHVYHLKVFTASVAACNVCDASRRHIHSPPVLRSPTSRQSSSRSSRTLWGRTPAARVSWTCWKKRQVSRKSSLVSRRWRLQRLPTMLSSEPQCAAADDDSESLSSALTSCTASTHAQVKAVITFSCWPRPLPRRCLPHKQTAAVSMCQKFDAKVKCCQSHRKKKTVTIFSDAHRYI